MSAANRPLSSSTELDKHALGLTFKNSLREWYARQKRQQTSADQDGPTASSASAGAADSRRSSH